MLGKNKRSTLLIALLIFALLLPGFLFGGGASEKTTPAAKKTSWVIGVSMGSLRAEWWSIMFNGIKELAAKHPEIKLISTDAGGDTQKQIADVNDLLTQGVDALLLFPNESAPLSAVAKAALAKKIPVFNFDIPLPEGSYTQLVAGDHYGCGQNDASLLVKLLTAKYGVPKGKLVEITGVEGTLTVTQRSAGFEEYIAKYPDIKIVAKDTGAWYLDKAYALTKNFLTANPDIDGIYCQNDNMALGAIKALEEMKLVGKVYVTGIDGDARYLKAIMEGKGTGCSTYSHVLGEMGLEYAIKFLKGETVPSLVIAPTYLVTKDNVTEFYDANYPAYVEPKNPAPAKVSGQVVPPLK